MIRLGKISVFILMSLLALVVLSGGAIAAEQKSQYEVLLERVKKTDPAVDFKQLRLEYTKTPQYNPNKDKTMETEMRKAFNNSDYLKAIEWADKILTENYVDLRAQTICAMAYKRIENHEEKAKYHKYVADGLIASIIYPVGGKSIETALTVISVDEEYVILQVLGFIPEKQELIKLNGHYYDRLQVNDPTRNTQFSMYFCVDIPFYWTLKNIQ